MTKCKNDAYLVHARKLPVELFKKNCSTYLVQHYTVPVSSEIEKGNGDVRDYNMRTAAAVLYDTSTRCTYSSLEPHVPGAAYLVYQAGSTCSRAR